MNTYFVQFVSGANWQVQASANPPNSGWWIVERFDTPMRSMGRWSINMDNVEAVQLKRPENK